MPSCIRCKKAIHPSNLISGSTCINCESINLKVAGKFYSMIGSVAGFYKYSFILAVIIGALYIFLNPPYVFVGILVIITILFTVLSLFGMLPYVFPSFSSVNLDEMEMKLKEEQAKYDPGEIAHCIYHLDREAVGRCPNCFQPFCEDDMIYLMRFPATCQNCGQKYYQKLHMWEAMNGILSLSLLSSVGIFLEITKSGNYNFYIFFIFAFIMYFCVVGVLFWFKHQVVKQMDKAGRLD